MMNEPADTLNIYQRAAVVDGFMSQTIDNPDDPAHRTIYFTLYDRLDALLPKLKPQVLLDLPCGTGRKQRRLQHAGFRKVVACDVMPQQIEIARARDQDAGTGPLTEYVVHDARNPKVLGSEPADVGLCIHLFCFARTRDELEGMARSVHLNLRRGGVCLIVMCALNRDLAKVREIRHYGFSLIQADAWRGAAHQPRRLSIEHAGLSFKSWVWSYPTLVEVLRHVGFRSVSMSPYRADPTYRGGLDLQRYLDIFAGAVVVAMK